MLELTGRPLALDEVARVADGRLKVAVSMEANAAMERSRAVVERILKEGRIVYGVNTGFGRLSDVRIEPSKLRALQVNLVRSHACGVGPLLPAREVRAMMLLRANVLASGYSGARPKVAQHVVAMLNAGVVPCVPEQGSVGASGDLAPLAHLALGAIGEGYCLAGSRILPAASALRAKGIAPLRLEAKEGLTLLNGTQAMAAVGGLSLVRAMRLAIAADTAAAMTLEALLGTPAAYDPRIHMVRPHMGQVEVADRMLGLLDGSEIRESHRDGDPRVQDAYSLRCVPQVHGAVLDALRFAIEKVEIETGSATDNPLVFAESGDVVSGGNFHGAPLALAFDTAAIALTTLMGICERRIDRLVNPDSNEGLPAFLASDAGTSSGLMIPHVVAAALLSEAKVLAHPASVDSVPTSGGKEDHVSMGMVAATKLRRIVENAERAIAIELIAAAEGIEHRRPLKAGRGVERAHKLVRSMVPRVKRDRSLTSDIEAIAKEIGAGGFGRP